MRISDWSSDVCSSDLGGESDRGDARRDLWLGGRATGAATERGRAALLPLCLRSLLRRGVGAKAVRLPCQRTAFRLRHGGASDGRRSQLARGAGGGGSPAGASDDRLLDELWGAGNPVGRRGAGRSEERRGGKECVSAGRERG